MAGAKELKIKFNLDGEAKLKKAFSDATNAVKELNSEQKLAAAQFEATGDAELYAAERARILKEKIAEQEKVVAAAESAIKSMKDRGVTPNSKEMVTWRTKLNQAKTSLVNMQTQLDRTEGELEDQGEALVDVTSDAGGYQEAMENAAKAVDFSATIDAINGVTEKIEKIISTAARAATAMWNLERGAAGWADELQTEADVAGLNVVDYQGWLYASQMIDSSVDSIRGAYKRLNKNLDEPTEDILLSLNELHVANLELNGSARQTMDVFWDVIDALGKVENTSRRDQLAMELFGKSFDDLLPLVKAGSKAYQEFIEKGKERAVSEENVGKLTELDDAVNDLNASFDQAKYTILAELAPAFTVAASAATNAIGSFNDFIASTEGQEALSGLKNAIEGIGNKLTDVDWQTQMGKVSGIIKSISNALAWFIDHKEVVIAAIGGLAAAWAGLKVASGVLEALYLLSKINWIAMSKVGSSNLGGGVKSAAESAIETAPGASKGKAVVSGLKTIGGAALKYLPAAALIGASIYSGKLLDEWQGSQTNKNWGKYQENVVEKLPELLERRDNAQVERLQQMLTDITDAIAGPDEMDLDADLSQPFKDWFRQYANDLLEAAPELDFWDMIKFSADTSDGLDESEIENVIRNIENADAWAELGREAAEALAAGITNGESETTAAAEEIADETESTIDSIDAESVGYNVGAGLAGGIYDGIPLAVGAAEAMGEAVSSALRWTLQVQSPSKVMERIGRFVTLGFAKGIEENVGSVERATSRMAYATMGRAAQTAPAAGAANPGGMVHITFVMDGRAIGEAIAPYVDGEIQAQVSRRR